MLYINKGLHNSSPQIIIITKLNLLRPSEQQVNAILSKGAEAGVTRRCRGASPRSQPTNSAARGVLLLVLITRQRDCVAAPSKQAPLHHRSLCRSQPSNMLHHSQFSGGLSYVLFLSYIQLLMQHRCTEPGAKCWISDHTAQRSASQLTLEFLPILCHNTEA